MTTRVFIFLLALLSFSCSRTGIQDHLEESDALVLQFYTEGEGGNEPGNRVVETTDKNAIRKMANQLDGKPASSNDNGCKSPDGFMIFQSGSEVLLKADFYLGNNCRFIVYPFNNTMQMRMISTEGVHFLEALKEGKRYY